MDNNTHKIVDTLMKEYELHRKELLLQIQLYNRQTQYIQLYSVFLLGLLAFFSGTSAEWMKGLFKEWIKHLIDAGVPEKIINEVMIAKEPSLPVFIPFILLTIAAFFAFYFVSTVMASSYMFLILRRRMAQIEIEINNYLKVTKVLNYETSVTPRFLERKLYSVKRKIYNTNPLTLLTLTPHFLSGIWRLILFGSIITVLSYMACLLLYPYFYVPYIIIVWSIALFQTSQYIWLNTKGRKVFDDFFQ